MIISHLMGIQRPTFRAVALRQIESRNCIRKCPICGTSLHRQVYILHDGLDKCPFVAPFWSKINIKLFGMIVSTYSIIKASVKKNNCKLIRSNEGLTLETSAPPFYLTVV